MTRVYFGTNRKPDDPQNPTDFTGEFSHDGLANLRFGEADVQGNQVTSINIFNENLTPAAGQPVLGSRHLFEGLRNRIRDSKSDVLVFIHGFNVSFHEALIDGAQMVEQYRIHDDPPAVVVFSWPSNGRLLHYENDRHDAQASGKAVARGLEKVLSFVREQDAQNACDRSVHFIAHSMGVYVLRWALQEMQLEFPRTLPRIFGQMFLVAADEDEDAFESDQKLLRLPELAEQVSIYFNRGDAALTTSDILKWNPDRLGSDGPRDPRSVHAKITMIDCSYVVGGAVEHSYYRDTPKVVHDINQTLSGMAADAGERERDYVLHRNHFRLRT